ncbi:MAG: hypothetical protein WCO10_02225 [bacterium]
MGAGIKIPFNVEQYNLAQVVDAMTCPVNRHATRAEHNCDDWELYKHPEWLFNHYIKHGGALEFAKRRAEFADKECDHLEVCGQNTECKIANIHHHWQHCAVRRMHCKARCQVKVRQKHKLIVLLEKIGTRISFRRKVFGIGK